MKLWKLTQEVSNGYDTYDSCIVAAETEEDAVTIHPGWEWTDGTWASDASQVSAVCIGEASRDIERGVALASFNAG